jgi:two-component system, chemotaxis family, CheB/CheR fusion protein
LNSNKKSKKNSKIERLSQSSNPNINRPSFPVVGIGASAGGLEAFIRLFKVMPIDSGASFILIQHLEPNHPSLSVEILSKNTQLKVEEVKEATKIQLNHIYVIPPNYYMEINNDILNLSARDTKPGQNMCIDFFFQSLARSQGPRAIGVILSGTGSDGTSGLWNIKVEGGLTYAQDPSSAKYAAMPENAITAGVVDHVLSPEDIAQEILRVINHPMQAIVNSEASDVATQKLHLVKEIDTTITGSVADEILSHIFSILYLHHRTDFTEYKKTTLYRRIQRRMVVKKTDNLADYLKILEINSEEVQALYNDILINVTEFFRDPKAFAALSQQIFTSLIDQRKKNQTIRIWVPGCSTGEEVYSIAICLLDFYKNFGVSYPIQIFATDISEHALGKARKGEFSPLSVQGLSQTQLAEYFDKIDNGFKISKRVRDLCLFSRHDVTTDPPFAKLDLISCRNVMIYFQKSLQKKVIPIFHYALNPGRFLWLGQAESLGEQAKLFILKDKTHKVYIKSSVPTPSIHLCTRYSKILPDIYNKPLSSPAGELQRMADQIVLERFSPPGVIVNADLEILHFRGRTTPFIEPSSGQASLNLLKMLRPELTASVRRAFQAAKLDHKSVERRGLHFDQEGIHKTIDLEVIPLNSQGTIKEWTYLILFKELNNICPVDIDKENNYISSNTTVYSNDTSIEELLQEIAEIKDYQQNLISQYETTQEELTSANEELLSANEEFQSTNEEIETAKEELQSTNEELTTVNEELQMRNLDLTTLSSDLNNILASIDLPLLIVDGDYRVRRFSPKAKSAFNLIPSDVGRPIADINPSFDLDLSHLIHEVSETLAPKKVEVQSFNGNWLRVHIRPYKTIENKLDGAIISLTDIDEIKKREEKTAEAFVRSDRDNIAKDVFLATLSHELRTPLSSILTWAQLIARGKVDFEQAKKGAKVIEQSARVQNQLIDDLLDISRITTGKISVDIQAIDPRSTIKSAIESIQYISQKKSVDIVFIIPKTVEMIFADSTRLQQIIWNLLTNAVKFSPPKSRITVELKYIQEDDKRWAKIIVSDQGKGISADFLPYIFNRFSQADGTSTRSHGGLGLGLSIVHSLVELQNGVVTAENTRTGSGAIFTVSLPAVSHHPYIQSTPDHNISHQELMSKNDSLSSQPQLSDLRILIVDDDQSIREALSIYFQSFGARVTTASSAAIAIETLSRFQPSIIISDIAMPDEDGFSFIKKIRSMTDPNMSKIPALALSACATDEDIKKALTAGFQAHLAKPVEAEDLAQLILNMLA